MSGMFDEVEKQVSELGADEIKAELARLLAADKKKKLAMKERNADPEVREKRKEYSTKYNEAIKADPEKNAVKVAKRKEYMTRPEVKERMKTYRNKRNATLSALKARAVELGIDLDSLTEAGA